LLSRGDLNFHQEYVTLNEEKIKERMGVVSRDSIISDGLSANEMIVFMGFVGQVTSRNFQYSTVFGVFVQEYSNSILRRSDSAGAEKQKIVSICFSFQKDFNQLQKHWKILQAECSFH
jgi:hypothetical protein